MTTPTFVGSNFVDISSSGFTVPAVSGVQADDFQIIIVGVGTSSETVTTPSGWTLAGSLTNSGGGDSFSMWVYVSTTVTGAQAFTKSGSRGSMAVRVAYRDHGDAQASSYSIVATGPSTSHAISARTVDANDSLVIGAVQTDSTVGMTFTPPSGWTERVDRFNTNEDQAIIVADIAAAAGTVNGTFTSSGSDHALTFAMVLAPGGGPKNVPVGRTQSNETAQPITARKNPLFVAVGRATETDQARNITGNIVRYIAVGRATETDTAPSVGQPVPVKVRLSTVWLNDLGNVSDYIVFENLAAMTVNKAVTGDVRRLAGGRRRLVRRKGKAYTHTLTLDHCDAGQRAWLDAHVGQVICIRDDRGRKVFGVYAQSDVTEHKYSDELGTVQIAVREVFHAET